MKNATRIVATTLGIVAGLGGLEHGIGEILQGNVAPASRMIESWPDAEVMRVLGGEPAMTLLPTLLISGVLTMVVSLVLLAWTLRFLTRRYGGAILMLLSLILLLVGGGFGPPLFGLIAGIVATRINAPHTWWRSHLSLSVQHSLAHLWSWSYALFLVAWLMVLPGAPIIAYFFPQVEAGVIYGLILLAFGVLSVTIVLGFVHDSHHDRSPTARLRCPALLTQSRAIPVGYCYFGAIRSHVL